MPATANPTAGTPASSRATSSLTTMNRARQANAARYPEFSPVCSNLSVTARTSGHSGGKSALCPPVFSIW